MALMHDDHDFQRNDHGNSPISGDTSTTVKRRRAGRLRAHGHQHDDQQRRRHQGLQIIENGGTAISTTINVGQQAVGGTAISTTINSGGLQGVAFRRHGH